MATYQSGTTNTRRSTSMSTHTTSAQTKSIPYEFNHSTNPVSDEEIRYFLETYINYKTDQKTAKEILFNGLKEVFKTPTGRMAFRATRAHLEAKRKAKLPYKLDLAISHESDVTYYGKACDNLITLYPNCIQKAYRNKKHSNFKIGATFLHEAMHTRNDYDDNKTISDATTSALTRQIAVESPYKEIRKREYISEKERTTYLIKAFNPDGSFNAEKARSHSAYMQQLYIQDFLLKPGERALVNYGQLSRQSGYVFQDIHNRLLHQKNNSPLKTSFNYINQRYHTVISYKDPINNQILKALSSYADAVHKHCTKDDLDHLSDSLNNQVEKLDRKNFSSNKAYKAALAYFKVSNDIQEKISLLAYYSHLIHSEPNNKAYLEKSENIRTHLHSKYDITFLIYNQSNERVADNLDVAKEIPDKPVDILLRNLDDIDAQGRTKNTNPTLAQNAQNLPDEKSSPTTYTEKTRTT